MDANQVLLIAKKERCEAEIEDLRAAIERALKYTATANISEAARLVRVLNERRTELAGIEAAMGIKDPSKDPSEV